MPLRTEHTLFGAELKRWRHHRRYSQLELASVAAISQRHLSFLETGRSRPSPEMVEHLSVVLDIPLRARNSLLNTAGFADAYSEEPLDGPALADVRASLETLVEAHNPFPAYVVDRGWNLLISNTAATRLTGYLVPMDTAVAIGGNVLRLFLHPDGVRNSVVNWPQAAAVLIERLTAECTANPTDTELSSLFAEVTSYDGVNDLRREAAYPSTSSLLTDIHIKTDAVDLRLYTTISTLAAAADITLQELRLETLLPADPETAQTLRQLRTEHPQG